MRVQCQANVSKKDLDKPDWRIILSRVPRRTELWSGTGTVSVVPWSRLCMMQWLPRLRTCANPCDSRIWHTSEPERTRSLPNRHLNLRHEHLAVQPARDFRLVRGLKEEGQRLDEVRACFLDGGSLTCNVKLRTQRNKAIVFSF